MMCPRVAGWLIQAGWSDREGVSEEVTYEWGPGSKEAGHAKTKGQNILGGRNRDALHPSHT